MTEAFVQQSIAYIRQAAATNTSLAWIVQPIPNAHRNTEQLYGFRVVPESLVPPSEDPHGHQRRHTELCRLHLVHHNCQFSRDCWFAHGIDELKPIIRSGRYKTRPCRTFSRSQKCRYGTRCHYIHELSAEDLARQIFTLSDIISEEQQPFSNMILAGEGDESGMGLATVNEESLSENTTSPEEVYNHLSPTTSPPSTSLDLRFDQTGSQNTQAKPLRELPMRSPWSFQRINPTKQSRRPSYPPNTSQFDIHQHHAAMSSARHQSSISMPTSPIQPQLRLYSPEATMDAFSQLSLNPSSSTHHAQGYYERNGYKTPPIGRQSPHFRDSNTPDARVSPRMENINQRQYSHQNTHAPRNGIAQPMAKFAENSAMGQQHSYPQGNHLPSRGHAPREAHQSHGQANSFHRGFHSPQSTHQHHYQQQQQQQQH
eukprot:TRINITY_DN5676_c0_g2_i4.p1 TRINITY_DN5676_c0_g2~~TRINITY_DN5676_c0_g2_i4.p1  ORF type:complete len:428 (-),score=71.83 TRINITY_DN5676_c0_g2_i4:351-1634(-)